ncbi:hypothetical protein Pint_02925 [Pistacia integerrima]|uniref:Uncharacterized protein n=1 Tax=Pistacia integerrima TaxID=434235 RepID=A0ACC0ZIR1_9ROSI|nr:hypothetical protein Pint_02925 [Pistacia integerrima]
METQLFIFLLLFFTIYLIAYFRVFRNWAPKIRPEASSCLHLFLPRYSCCFFSLNRYTW